MRRNPETRRAAQEMHPCTIHRCEVSLLLWRITGCFGRLRKSRQQLPAYPIALRPSPCLLLPIHNPKSEISNGQVRHMTSGMTFGTV